MIVSRIESPADTSIHTARYTIVCEPDIERAIRGKVVAMKTMDGSLILGANDMYHAHSAAVLTGRSSGIPHETLDEVRRLRDSAHGQLEARLETIGRSLYDFQVEGVEFLRSNRQCLLADEMGLGKTVQALCALPEKAHGIIVAPRSLLYNWKDEGESWRPDLSFDVVDRSGLRGTIPGEFIIATPDAVRLHHADHAIPMAMEPPPVRSVCVLDEAHMYKTCDASRTKAIRRLVAHYDCCWLMTGTPLANKPPDLWHVLQTADLGRMMFGHWGRFSRIMGGHRLPTGEWMWDRNAIDGDALADSVRIRSLRRLRRVVAPQIPEKTYTTIRSLTPVISPDDKRELARAQRAMESDTKLSDRQLGELSRLRAKLAESKAKTMLDVVSRFVDESQPLVVVSANIAPLEALADKYGCPLIIGSVSAEDRNKAVKDFQSGTTKLIGIHPLAGGVGITLTAAHHLLFVQRDWSAAVNSQAEDRINRLGQRETCVIYDIVSGHPLDTRIFSTLMRKQDLMSTVSSAIPSSAER